LNQPVLWVALVYACGVLLRLLYSLSIQPPESLVYSDMGLYVGLSRKIAAHIPLSPPDVTHPLGYSSLLAYLASGGSLAHVVTLQIVISCLVPPAVGLLGAAAYGRRTGLLALVFASLYFPFIEYGALILSEIHFILFLTLAFAAWFAARRVRRRVVALGLAAAGGIAISIAAAFKSVALPAAFLFFVVDGIALAITRAQDGPPSKWLTRLKPWVLRGAVAAIAAAPLLGGLAQVCTRANNDRFCVTGNKMPSDLLLGHYGRIADIEWRSEGRDVFRFGSPGAVLRNYQHHVTVPFSMTDGPANTREAWRWIRKHPGEAIVLSLDHIYDTFFGAVMWPTFNHGSWPYGHLSQYLFIVLLFVPGVLACTGIVRQGWRAVLTSRTALVLAPVAALTVTVAVATGEVRYRIPFDVFFIALVCAYAVGDLARIDGPSRSLAKRGSAAT
jgi:4-amino-4-deoxy-L-arabinose transferase-like glycosyltransferase